MANVSRMAQKFMLSFRRFHYHLISQVRFHLPAPWEFPHLVACLVESGGCDMIIGCDLKRPFGTRDNDNGFA